MPEAWIGIVHRTATDGADPTSPDFVLMQPAPFAFGAFTPRDRPPHYYGPVIVIVIVHVVGFVGPINANGSLGGALSPFGAFAVSVNESPDTTATGIVNDPMQDASAPLAEHVTDVRVTGAAPFRLMR